MGKSTFAQGLAEFYGGQDKIVKTVEAPRDLVLPENITQYAEDTHNPKIEHALFHAVCSDGGDGQYNDI